MPKNFELKHKDLSRAPQEDLEGILSELGSYVSEMKKINEAGDYSKPESSINLVDDSKLRKIVEEVAEQKTSVDLKYIFVVGIGGSNLGTRAVYDSLRGDLSSYDQDFPKIIFIDTVDPSLLVRARAFIKNELEDKEEFMLTVVSKSGKTMETIANFEILQSALNEKFGNIQNRIVAITDKDSSLDDQLKDKNIETLYISQKVGGRFSVFSPVGLFPLYLAEEDVRGLLDGALNARKRCLREDLKNNPAAVSASLIYYWHQEGIDMNVNFLFDPDLENIGNWYRQLMAESLGKEFDLSQTQVNEGITPIVSIGSTDLHSQAQLYFGGPKDKFFNLVSVKGGEEGPSVPEDLFTEDLVSGISGKSVHSLMDALYGGVRRAFRKNELPFMETILNSVSAPCIGAYLQFKMIEMMYLAYLMDINAFDQPNVEDYKKETRQLLGD